MPVPSYTYLPSLPAAMSSRNRLPRPRGLWKAARETPKPSLDAPKRPRPDDHSNRHPIAQYLNGDDNTSSDDCCDSDSSTGSLSKRVRFLDSPPTSEEDEQDGVIFWDYSRKCSSRPERVSQWTTRSKVMDTSSTVGPGIRQDPTTYNLEDWEDLKELFSKAVDIYEHQEPSETIPFLRGVIHECHRFMKAFHDPSCLFATSVQPDRPTTHTPTAKRVVSEWSSDRPSMHPPTSHPHPNFKRDQTQQISPAIKPTILEPEKKCKCKDLPTAFHTILGTTLFLFGNLIALDQSLVLQGEPSTPTPYWLSTIDVFHIGENLPIRTSGRGCPNAPEDWRMAVVWGRTLVNLADEILTRQKTPSTPIPPPMFHSPTFDPRYAFTSVFLPPTNSADEPKWPPDSPFALIAARRPTSSFRINLNVFTPHELLQLAQDQFSRGIFHMPHQRGMKFQRSIGSRGSSSTAFQFADIPKPPLSLSLAGSTFSRGKELYTIGSEVLLLAEKLDIPSERCHWARWADGIFGQMGMELTSLEDTWKVSLAISRGRSNLVMGSAMAEEMDNELERGDLQVLDTTEAEDARDALEKSISFLEKARQLISSGSPGVPIPGPSSSSKPPHCCDSKTTMVDISIDDFDEDIQAAILDDSSNITMSMEDSPNDETFEQAEIRTLLAEALLTLANLTVGEMEREALYVRAHKEGKGSFELDDDRMDESS